jgi:hypothetical protein
MALLLITAAFLATIAAIVAATVAGLRFAGIALNGLRPAAQRWTFGALALACAIAVPAAAVGGFSILAAVAFHAQGGGAAQQ